MVKFCAVKSCRSTSTRNPNRNFYSIPKNSFLREEWLNVLNVRGTADVFVCELHFRSIDFAKNRKSLKTHVVPIVRSGNANAENSEEEFGPDEHESSSDPEIVEVKSVNVNKKSPVKVKEEPKEENIKEPPPPMEPETGRRPSRRAAQLAVQKIHNTVRQFGLTDTAFRNETAARQLGLTDTALEAQRPESQIKVEPKFTNKRTNYSPKVAPKRIREVTKEWHAIRAPVPDIDLLMVCHEELLSAVQAETILKAQREYNAVMKRLRILKANNVKITCLNNDDDLPAIGSISVSGTPTPNTPKPPNVVTLTPVNTTTNSPNIITVVPVHLVTVPSQSGQNSIKPPGSPAVFKNITAD